MQVNYSNCLFANGNDYAAVNSFTAEATLLGTLNQQPFWLAPYFGTPDATGRALRLLAGGVLSTTGTPTYQFTARASPTQGSATLGGSVLGISQAITTISGVTNAMWGLELDIVCKTPGQGTTNATLTCRGKVWSPTGFASPFTFALQPTTPESATWTRTLDGVLTQYLNLDVTCSASSASNGVQCKFLELWALN